MNENKSTLRISVDNLKEELKELLVAAVLKKIDILNEEMDLPENAVSIEEVEQDIKDFAIMFRNAAKNVPILKWSDSQQDKLQTIILMKNFKEMGIL